MRSLVQSIAGLLRWRLWGVASIQKNTDGWVALAWTFAIAAGLSSVATATPLFSDEFDGVSLDGSKWHLPAWTPDGATFLGRTQLRVSQTVPLPLPTVANGVVRLALSTYNPTAPVPGDSFYGSEIISNPAFSIGNGIVIEVRARLVSPIPGGIVGGIFGYNAPTTAGGPHDEVDFEFLSNRLNQVQTQVYANEPLGPGHPVFYNLPSGLISDFHTYRMEVMPDRVAWYIDNTLLRTDTTNVPKGAMQFYLNVWVPAADWSDAYNATLQPSATASANQDYFMEVDSVVISSGLAPANYGGLWWNSPAGSESGWGINFAHQGDIIFATWFTYDTTGKAWWLSMTALQSAPNIFSGTLFQTTGPAFDSVPFDPRQVAATPVGTGTLTFTDANNGSFSYTVNGVTQTKSITRQVFGPLPTCVFGVQPDLTLATNYQDLWWAAPAGIESGWGINFAHQGDIIFATWFTYDRDGTPLWLSATALKSSPSTYSGTLYRTSGPAFNAVSFDPTKIVATAVGNVVLAFTDGNTASFAYTVNGETQTKQIARQVFRTPGTVCQ